MEKLPQFVARQAPSIADEDNANLVRKNFDAIINAEVIPPDLAEIDTTGDKVVLEIFTERVPLVVDGVADYYDVACSPSEAGSDPEAAAQEILDAIGGGLPDGYDEVPNVRYIYSSGGTTSIGTGTFLIKSS